MPRSAFATPVNQRVHKRRVALRAAGLRPVQLWVPDTRRGDFAAKCRRQCERIRSAPGETDAIAWAEAAAASVDGWS